MDLVDKTIVTSNRVIAQDFPQQSRASRSVNSSQPGNDSAIFEDDSSAAFDAIILATGLRPKLDFLNVKEGSQWQADPRSIPTGGNAALPNLYFCGFHVPATGMLREISIEARRIVAQIAAESQPK